MKCTEPDAETVELFASGNRRWNRRRVRRWNGTQKDIKQTTGRTQKIMRIPGTHRTKKIVNFLSYNCHRNVLQLFVVCNKRTDVSTRSREITCLRTFCRWNWNFLLVFVSDAPVWTMCGCDGPRGPSANPPPPAPQRSYFHWLCFCWKQMEEYADWRNCILGIMKAHYNVVKTRPSNVNCGNINAFAMGPTHVSPVQKCHHREFIILFISSSEIILKKTTFDIFVSQTSFGSFNSKIAWTGWNLLLFPSLHHLNGQITKYGFQTVKHAFFDSNSPEIIMGKPKCPPSNILISVNSSSSFNRTSLFLSIVTSVGDSPTHLSSSVR